MFIYKYMLCTIYKHLQTFVNIYANVYKYLHMWNYSNNLSFFILYIMQCHFIPQ